MNIDFECLNINDYFDSNIMNIIKIFLVGNKYCYNDEYYLDNDICYINNNCIYDDTLYDLTQYININVIKKIEINTKYLLDYQLNILYNNILDKNNIIYNINEKEVLKTSVFFKKYY